MVIDRILFPITTLGPGNRLVIWTRGCSKYCKKCANPELWEKRNFKQITPEELFHIINNIHKETQIDGITISGGDPLEQIDELLMFLRMVKSVTDDILVYTGFVYEHIRKLWSSNIILQLEENIGVLIDGPYIDEKNESFLVLTGSSNQKIYFFQESLREKYGIYLQGKRKIQNVYMGNKLVSVGIHNREEVDK